MKIRAYFVSTNKRVFASALPIDFFYITLRGDKSTIETQKSRHTKDYRAKKIHSCSQEVHGI